MKKESEIKMDNIEDFKRFASGMTREEFKEDYLIDEEGDDYEFYIKGKNMAGCPKHIGLMQVDECINNCGRCWDNGIKDIYFKDDINRASFKKAEKNSITYDYNKEYTLQEVFTFPRETKFITTDGEGEIKVDNDIIFLLDSDENIWEQCYLTKKWLNMKFKLIQEEKEVTFSEVLNSNNNVKCRVEHYLIDEMNIHGVKEHMYFANYMINLCESDEADNSDIKEIIRDGKWLVKEER